MTRLRQIHFTQELRTFDHETVSELYMLADEFMKNIYGTSLNIHMDLETILDLTDLQAALSQVVSENREKLAGEENS